MFRLKICNTNFVTKIVWLVTEIFWLKFSYWNFVTVGTVVIVTVVIVTVVIGEICSNLYRVSVCYMKKGTFLLISLSKILFYTLQTTWYGIAKNILGKLPDHWWLQINTFNFEGCHTLTHIFQILIIIFFNPIDDQRDNNGIVNKVQL